MKTKKSLILISVFVLGLILCASSTFAQDVKVDEDGDDLDDSWELNIIQKNGLGHNNVSMFLNYSDPDNDGFTNLQEYNNGTDPYNKEDTPGEEKDREKGTALFLLGVAICIGVPGIMAAFGLYIAGVSAVGMTTEHTDRFSKGLILQALPMTQGVYGLVFAILLLLGVGYIGSGDPALLSDPTVGWGAIMIGITIALTSVSAIPQGLVAGAGASGVGRNPDIFTKGLIYAVMPETMAVFGFLISLFIIRGIGLM